MIKSKSNDGLFLDANFSSSSACCLFFNFSNKKKAKLILRYVSFGNLINKYIKSNLLLKDKLFKSSYVSFVNQLQN